MIKMIKNNKKIELFILFFLLIYGFSINGISMRFPILILIIIITIFNFKNFLIPKRVLCFIFALFLLAAYSFVIAKIYNTNDYFETFRFLRCVTTSVLLDNIIWNNKLDPESMIDIIEMILFANALVIIFTIVFPETKGYFEIVNLYSKTYSRWRAIGLLNGEDIAGFFCNLGLIIETIKGVQNNESPLTIKMFIFAIATIFTSRFAIMFLLMILFFDLFILFRKKDFIHSFLIILILLPFAFFGVMLWIITTNVAYELREPIYQLFPTIRLLQKELIDGYVDYGVYTSIISRHFSIGNMSLDQLFFGSGYRTDLHKDVGYIKTIYSIGLFGLFSELIFYIKTCKTINRFKINSKINISVIYIICVLFLFMWEFKNSFLFSSGVFEIYTAIFFSFILCNDIQKQK